MWRSLVRGPRAACVCERGAPHGAGSLQQFFKIRSILSMDQPVVVLPLPPPPRRGCLKRAPPEEDDATSPTSKRRVVINDGRNVTKLVAYYGRPAQSPEMARASAATRSPSMSRSSALGAPADGARGAQSRSASAASRPVPGRVVSFGLGLRRPVEERERRLGSGAIPSSGLGLGVVYKPKPPNPNINPHPTPGQVPSSRR